MISQLLPATSPTKYFRTKMKLIITFRNAYRRGFPQLSECFSMAEKTIEKFLARAVRVYEQEQGGVFRLPLACTIREGLGCVLAKGLYTGSNAMLLFMQKWGYLHRGCITSISSSPNSMSLP